MELDVMLGCGLHVWVSLQGNGAGGASSPDKAYAKEHEGEYLWCVDCCAGTIVHARGYDPDKAQAIKKAKDAARTVLAKSFKELEAPT